VSRCPQCQHDNPDDAKFCLECDYHRALTLQAKAVELLRGDLDHERLGRNLYPAVNARSELAVAHAELGQFDRALAVHEEALRLADGLGHTTTLLTARLESYQTLVRRAAFYDAIPRLEATIQALHDAGLLVWVMLGSANLGYSLVMTGRAPEGIALLRDVLEQTARGRRTYEARWMAYLCEAYLRAGQVAEARDLGERALGLSRQRVERNTEAHILYLVGAIEAQATRDGDAATAEHHYTAAMALAQELGMRPLDAHCHLGLGKLYRHTGKREQAREHFTAARAMYRAMDMRFWLEQTEAESRALG
jgi:tetratricopeptide (TPR) repeat protein